MCGSDDGWVYIWETGLAPPAQQQAPQAPPPGATGRASTGKPTAAKGSSGKVGAGKDLAAASGRGGGGSGSAFKPGKVKEGLYEAFQTPEPTVTVAMFAPEVCR